MIAVIDYDAGNIKSVEKALASIGQNVIVTRDSNEILRADRVILPGVGAFGDAMDKLTQYNLIDTIHEVIDKGHPFMGICLGLQLLFDSSEESEGVQGLSVLPGKVVRFPDSIGLKIPQIGWNSLEINPDSRLFKGVSNQAYTYFVHSYYLQADEPEIVAATCEYGVKVHAAVEKNNVFACQFHPEKSSSVGLQILKNFSTI